MAERRSLCDRHPDYRGGLEPTEGRVRVLDGFVAFCPGRVEWQFDEDEGA